MHLSVPFDIAVTSPQRGVEAATPADGIEYPAGFGAVLADAFGIALRGRPADRSAGPAVLAGAPDGDGVVAADVDPTISPEDTDDESVDSADVPALAEDASNVSSAVSSSEAAASEVPRENAASEVPPQDAASVVPPQGAASVVPPEDVLPSEGASPETASSSGETGDMPGSEPERVSFGASASSSASSSMSDRTESVRPNSIATAVPTSGSDGAPQNAGPDAPPDTLPDPPHSALPDASESDVDGDHALRNTPSAAPARAAATAGEELAGSEKAGSTTENAHTRLAARPNGVSDRSGPGPANAGRVEPFAATSDPAPEASMPEGAETERRSTSGRVPDSTPGASSARSSDPGEPHALRAAELARAPRQGAEAERVRVLGTENVSARDAALSSGTEASAETDSPREGGEPLSAAPDDAAGQDEAASAPGPSDDRLHRTSTARGEGGARHVSDRPQAADGGSTGFSEGDADTQSGSREQHVVSVSGQDGTEAAADDAAPSLEAPSLDFAQGAVQESLEPNVEGSTFAPEQKTAAGSASLAEAVPSSDRSRAPGSIAWLRSMLAQSSRTLDLTQGWKSIEVQLEDGLGTMTVRARRTKDGMAVSVAFTDPNLRTLAEANTHRLQDVLRAEYETNVDLSLMGDDSAGTPGERNPAEQGRSLRPAGASPGITGQSEGHGSSAQRRPALGTRNEWIG